MNASPSLSVVVPTIDETAALDETVRLLTCNPSLHIQEVLLIHCE